MAALIRVLKNNPNYARLWLAQVISLMGDWFNTIVLSTLVAKYSDGSGLAVSLFLAARFAPPLIVGPFAGVIVDRFNRKKILIASNIFRTGIVLLFLLATTPDMLWLIYLLTMIQFTFSALFEPAQSAIVPTLVSGDELVQANTLSNITWSVMLAVGAVFGGIVSAVMGPAAALMIDAGSFLASALLISRIQLPEKVLIPRTEETASQETGSLMEGIRYLLSHPATAAVALIKGASSIGNVDTLMTIYATQIFITQFKSELSLGFMYSAFGIGALVGPLFMNRFNDGSVTVMRRLITFGFCFIFAGWVLLWNAHTLLLVLLGLTVRAMGGSLNWTYSSVILQKSVPNQYLGRVFSLDLAIFQLSTVLSIFLHGGIIDIIRQNAEGRLPIAVPFVAFPAQMSLTWHRITTSDLGTVSLGMAVVSMVPLIAWAFVIYWTDKRRSGYRIAAVETV